MHIASARKACIVMFCTLLVCVFGLSLVGCKSGEVQEGRTRLDAMSERPIEEVQAAITQARWQQRIDAFWAYADDGRISRDEADSVFEGVVFIGDSITQGVNVYGYLGLDKVVAKVGVSLHSAGEMVTQAAQLYPTHVVLAFGENDLIADRGDANAYIESLDTVVAQIRSEIPGARIYVASILPPADFAIAKQSVLGHWSEFNDAMAAYASNNDDVTYIDTAAAGHEHMDMHEPDGMHFNGEFYSYYLAKAGSVIFS